MFLRVAFEHALFERSDCMILNMTPTNKNENQTVLRKHIGVYSYHYEITPIQIYRTFHLLKLKIFI